MVVSIENAKMYSSLEKLVDERTSQLEEKSRMLEEIASHDALTGLPNRRLFYERLKNSINNATRTARTIGILFIDLDGFKSINDTYGHEAGDDVLLAVAHRLMTSVRKKDTVARLGGDEFTIIVENYKDTEELIQLCQRVIEMVAQPIDLSNDNKGHVTASIGISCYPDDSIEMDVLLSKADDAMYESKKAGKNQFTFSKEPAIST
jgi:diguanylate cyclase (GGDEF)-like protein